MPRRNVLTERQRSALLNLPTDESSLLKHYTLADDDLELIRGRRRPENRMGFALQLCALRYPGRLLYPGELIPNEVLTFIGAQIGLTGDALLPCAVRRQTRQEHLVSLRSHYGYKSFSGRGARDIKNWLHEQAEDARSSEDLAQQFVGECRQTHTILPGASTIERLCADALVDAERQIEARVVQHLDAETCERQDELLNDIVDGSRTRFVWLSQFQVGNNSADASRLLDRLEFLQGIKLAPEILLDVPPHRVTRLRRQGERYFADGLRDISGNRRLAILAVCVLEWTAAIADTIVETHDRIVCKTWREARRLCDARIDNVRKTVQQTLRPFTSLGASLLEAKEDDLSLEQAVMSTLGWDGLQELVATGSKLTDTMSGDPLAHVAQGYHRFRRYAPRMLKALEIEAAPVASPLMAAANLVGKKIISQNPPTTFLRRSSKWHRHMNNQEDGCTRLWEVAVLFNLRDAFRSGDMWLRRSRRYTDLKEALVPIQAAQATTRLAVPFNPEEWLADRQNRMEVGLNKLAKATRDGAIPNGSIENGLLHIDRLTAKPAVGADELLFDLYHRMPAARITDILIEIDDAIGFTDAFTHLRTGAPCKDKLGLLNVLLGEGVNLGLRKMSEASNSHDYWELMRISRWHIESDAMNRALATVVEAQSQLPMAQFWGSGSTASSDGQFFPTTRQGEAMNLINAKYGHEPGLKAYSHLSDQFAPFAIQTIPSTVNEAPYILDGLLMNETGRNIQEQYADTGGFTDQVFAVTALLGYQFIPRIRDLPSKRLYVFDPASTPEELRGLIGGKVRDKVISSNWPDILRSVATMIAGVMPPSQLLRKFASYPRQHDLAVALREVGRVERTLFIIEWILDTDMQRRAQVGLNKGESHHALKNALRIGRQGEIRDRTSEGQHYRMAGLNLLAAIVIYWNTLHLGHAVAQRQERGLPVPPELLPHISPLGWAHILLTGEYRWPRK
ncbi:MAG: Tn3 family transposase [Halioglobus sp.]